MSTRHENTSVQEKRIAFKMFVMRKYNNVTITAMERLQYAH